MSAVINFTTKTCKSALFLHRETISESDIEDKFETLMTAFALDASTVRQRYQRQKERMERERVNLAAQLEVLEKDVKQKRNLDMLEYRIGNVKVAFSRAVASAEQYGAMFQEKRITNVLSLVRDYVGILRRKLNDHLQCQSTG